MYTIRDIPGNTAGAGGRNVKGVFATRPIPKGTRILAERPLILGTGGQRGDTAESIRSKVESLTDDERQRFLDLPCRGHAAPEGHDADDLAEWYVTIFLQNALPIDEAGMEKGIFLHAHRIRQNCRNSAHGYYNPRIERYTVHAVRDIEQGEEITVDHFASTSAGIRHGWQHEDGAENECTCDSCRLVTEEELARSNGIRARINALGDMVRDVTFNKRHINNRFRRLEYIDTLVQMYQRNGPVCVGMAFAYNYAALLCISHSDLARGILFFERLAELWGILEGADSPRAIQARGLAEDPSQHAIYGTTDWWESTADESPRELDPRALDDWLWRREKLLKPGEVADLRDESRFPAFADLPQIGQQPNYEIHVSNEGRYFQLRRQWCLLGEVVSFAEEPRPGGVVRYTLTIRDVDGDREADWDEGWDGYPVVLALRDPERQLDLVGRTVAILHAERQRYQGAPGIVRCGTPGFVKFFPCSLEQLLALSDRVQLYAPEINGQRRCHGCDKEGPDMERRPRCFLFWYCNETCRFQALATKDHAWDCKIIRDGDLRGLFTLDWDLMHEFEGWRFPE